MNVKFLVYVHYFGKTLFIFLNEKIEKNLRVFSVQQILGASQYFSLSIKVVRCAASSTWIFRIAWTTNGSRKRERWSVLLQRETHLGVGDTATCTNRMIMRVVTRCAPRRLTLEKMRLDWSRWCITVHFLASKFSATARNLHVLRSQLRLSFSRRLNVLTN